jgi:hypothetical protein
MLFGYRPYGEGKSQENVWQEGLIFRASHVEFPTDPKAPKVSEEAKDMIRACLTKDQRLRCVCVFMCVFMCVYVCVCVCVCVREREREKE